MHPPFLDTLNEPCFRFPRILLTMCYIMDAQGLYYSGDVVVDSLVSAFCYTPVSIQLGRANQWGLAAPQESIEQGTNMQ